MPLYEYECDACGHRFEIIQRFSDAPPKACPVCGGAVHKMQSAPAFQFKGTGWYITDYARKDQDGGSKETAKSETAGGEKGTASTSDAPKNAKSEQAAKDQAAKTDASTPAASPAPASASKSPDTKAS